MTNAELIAELRGHILSVPLTLLHDAADALEELQQIADHYEQTAKDYWKEAREYKQRIAELEAVDAVPVVRCGECKHFIEPSWECRKLIDRDAYGEADARVYPDYFCADGERKDGESDV